MQKVDVIIVVDAKNNYNSIRLCEIGTEMGAPRYLIADSARPRPEWVENARAVDAAGGASAPEQLVQDVVHWLGRFGPVEISTLIRPDESIQFRLPANLARA